MPNWTDTTIKLEGDLKDCMNVCNRFVTIEREADYAMKYEMTNEQGEKVPAFQRARKYNIPIKRPILYRTFTFDNAQALKDQLETNYDNTTNETETYVNCAWSADSCLLRGGALFEVFEQRNPIETTTLPELCKKYNVSAEIYSDEPGIDFYEKIRIDNTGEVLTNEAYDVTRKFQCTKCGEPYYYGSGYTLEEIQNISSENIKYLYCQECDEEGTMVEVDEYKETEEEK